MIHQMRWCRNSIASIADDGIADDDDGIAADRDSDTRIAKKGGMGTLMTPHESWKRPRELTWGHVIPRFLTSSRTWAMST